MDANCTCIGMTIHWKALEEHFLGICIFLNFSQKSSALKELKPLSFKLQNILAAKLLGHTERGFQALLAPK
jgi:hypothetical protein